MDTPSPIFTKKGWQGFAIRKFQNTIQTVNYIEYETRNSSTIAIIKNGITKNNTSDFGWILVNTSDRDDFSWLSKRRVAHDIVIDDVVMHLALFLAATPVFIKKIKIYFLVARILYMTIGSRQVLMIMKKRE